MNFRLKPHSLLFLVSSVLFSLSLHAQCKVSDIVEQGKIGITDPYLYDGFSMTQFTMDDKPKTMQVEFTALKHQEYKLYFRTSGFDEELKISVFDAQKNDTILNVISEKEKTVVFEVLKAGNYTVQYQIPTCENAEYGNVKKECVLMLISYKRK
jgi:hypothetical protein